MSNKKILFFNILFIIFCLLIVVGCSPSKDDIETAEEIANTLIVTAAVGNPSAEEGLHLKDLPSSKDKSSISITIQGAEGSITANYDIQDIDIEYNYEFNDGSSSDFSLKWVANYIFDSFKLQKSQYIFDGTVTNDIEVAYRSESGGGSGINWYFYFNISMQSSNLTVKKDEEVFNVDVNLGYVGEVEFTWSSEDGITFLKNSAFTGNITINGVVIDAETLIEFIKKYAQLLIENI